MHRASWLVGLGAALLFGSAHARYVSLTPPSGYSAGGGPGGSYAAAAGAISNAKASSNFTGSVTKIPAGMRYAAGASRIAARALGLSPFGLGIAGAAWFASKCVAVEGGQFVLTCGGDVPPQSDGNQWRAQSDYPGRVYSPTKELALLHYVDYLRTQASAGQSFNALGCGTGNCLYTRRDSNGVTYGPFGVGMQGAPSSCPAGWYITPGGCVQTPPPQVLTPQEVEEELAPSPLPDGVPQEIPNVPLPIELPIWQPYIEPIGNPVPVPNSNPQTYKQPGIKLTPAPAVGDPWRADAEPVETPTDSPDPVEGPQPVPGVGQPQPEPAPTPTMCEENPGILACEKLKLGELTPDQVKNTAVPLAINPDSGFPSGGACPAPKTHVLMGRSFQFSVQPICDFASMIRPLLIGFAWLAAAMTFLGVARREN